MSGASEAPVSVRYTNWRGETSTLRLILGDVRFGATDWHPEPTWLISAFDLDHPAQIWKEFDLTKCDFTDLPPTDAQVMAHPKVRGLVEALERISSPSQTNGLLWWQQEARAALADLHEPPE